MCFSEAEKEELDWACRSYESSENAHKEKYVHHTLFDEEYKSKIAIKEVAKLPLTYSELASWSRSLGDLIKTKTSLTVVAVTVRRSACAYACIYGILFSGKAFIAIDLQRDNLHQKYSFLNSTADLVLTEDKQYFQGLSSIFLSILTVSNEPIHKAREETITVNEATVYLSLTSGTSGRAKCVIVPHDALCDRLDWFESEYKLAPSGRLFCRTNIVFAVSEWELFWPIRVGATAIIADGSRDADTTYLAQACLEERADIMFCVTSLLKYMIQDSTSMHPSSHSLRYCLQCGEVLDATTAYQFYRSPLGFRAQLHNIYGATEASITRYKVPRDIKSTESTIPAGWPAANALLVILSPGQLSPVAFGQIGEVCFGFNLATGYLTDTNTQSFVKDIPEHLSKQLLGVKRLYRTGDLGWRRSDGAVLLKGRTDRQIKVRGERINLNDLENHLLNQSDDIQEVACVHLKHMLIDTVVAFIVGAATLESLPALSKRTGIVVKIEIIPRLSSGKPDYQTLQSMALERVRTEDESELDSLGMARQHLGKWRARRAFSTAARAWGSYGVILDHWNFDGGALSEDTYASLVTRSIGNAQSMFLFVLADACDDAAAERHTKKFQVVDSKDFVLFVLYLLMRWPLVPLLCLGSSAQCPGVFLPRYTHTLRFFFGVDADWDVIAVHRWYLYFGIFARLSARLLRSRKRLVIGSCAYFVLALIAPFSMLVTWNLSLRLSSSPLLRFAADWFFWGGVIAWPGLFSMLGLYLAGVAFFVSPPQFVQKTTKFISLSCLYLLLCVAWTKYCPSHDALFHANFKLHWGFDSISFVFQYLSELAANTVLAVLFFHAAAAAIPLPPLVHRLASSSLGTFVFHPYFLRDATAYFLMLNWIRSNLGPLARFLFAVALPLFFQYYLGPPCTRILHKLISLLTVMYSLLFSSSSSSSIAFASDFIGRSRRTRGAEE